MKFPDRHSRSAVLFDLDGTLVDSGADIAAAANHARGAAGLAPLPEAVAVGYVGDGVQSLLERVLAHDPETAGPTRVLATDEVPNGLAAFFDYYEEHLLDQTVLYPGVDELLRALAGRRLLVATNKPRRFTLAILAGLGIAGSFERVTAGDDVSARKPDPAHLAACLAGTGIDPDAAVMVGDSPNDILAARGFPMRSVAVSWGLVARVRLEAAEPDALVDRVEELARELGVVI